MNKHLRKLSGSGGKMFFAVFFLVAVAGFFVPNFADAAISNFNGFESGALDWPKEGCCSYSQTIVSSPVRAGGKALRTELRITDPIVSNNSRAEIYSPNSWGDEEVEGWYGASIYLPSDFQSDQHKEIILQFRGSDYTSNCSAVSNPYWALRTASGNWIITDESPNPGSTIQLGSYAKGKWTDWVFHVVWSPKNTGLFEVWRDGVKVITKTNESTACDGSGNHIRVKLGIYKAGWKTSTDTTTSKRVVYHDEIRIGDKTSCYNEVAPGLSSSQRVCGDSNITTPTPTLSLTANPTSRIGAGSSVLTWTTNNATSCWASGGASGDGWYNSWKTATNGAHTLSVSVPSTRTYSMECWNSAGTSSGVRSVTVTINAPASCTLPWGGSIASGASVTAYSTNSVACGSSCVSQTRTCTSGVLSGTYTNQNCSVAACPANIPPSASITTPSSDGTSVTKGSALNFSGSIADSDNSSLTHGWYIDRIGDGFLEALIKQGTQTPGNTSGSIAMTGTKTNIANPSQAISLDTVGATYNLILKVSDGTNTEVQTIRSFTLTDSAPAQSCGDQTCNNGETCSTCPQDCGACPKTYNLTDFTKLVTDWLKSMTGSPADVNSDGKVNSQDLGIMMSNWQ